MPTVMFFIKYTLILHCYYLMILPEAIFFITSILCIQNLPIAMNIYK